MHNVLRGGGAERGVRRRRRGVSGVRLADSSYGLSTSLAALMKETPPLKPPSLSVSHLGRHFWTPLSFITEAADEEGGNQRLV